ncbi:MAG: PIN domain-containing protein [Halobacteriales archaeon]|nr:PIN domain-containing protein [Halobacteriales archaeon]
MILDTNFLGALKDQHPGALQKSHELELSGEPLRIPTIVSYELFISVGKTGVKKYKQKDRRAYRRLTSSKPKVEITEEIATRAGILEGEHQRSDSKPTLGPGDAIVAATARHYDEPVVSDDGDFDDVDGVERIEYEAEN